MKKYIDADLFKALIAKNFDDLPLNVRSYERADALIKILDKFPAAPVRPEVHAYWNKKYEKVLPLCSNCGKSNLIQMPKRSKEKQYTPFCPNCGARMDGKKEDAK